MSDCEIRKDAGHDDGFIGIDDTAAADRVAASIEFTHDAVAIGLAAAGAALADASLDPAMGLEPKVFEEQRVHRALEPDMEFADLAFGNRDKCDVAEADLLEEGGDMFLVAANAIERLGDDQVGGAA